MHLYNVLISRPFDKEFTYASAHLLEAGTVVYINFAGAKVIGVIIGNSIEEAQKNEQNSTNTSYKIKSILHAFPLRLQHTDLQFLEKASRYNIAYRGMFLKQMLPKDAMEIPKPQEEKKKKRAIANISDVSRETYKFALHTLNVEQETVYTKIASNLKQFKAHLIDGETGSGKTEIYLKLAYDIIATQERQVLILLPEIFLTKQLITRFTERIGCKPTEWHSRLTPKKRRENFHKIITGKSKFIIGARSALFLPYHNLGIIVVDEEHDRSYKQEEISIYNARDMAILKAQLFNINVVLTSATPSLESFHNAQVGRYEYHQLHNRFGNSTLPEVKIVDLNKHKLGKDRLISEPLLQNIKQVLEDKKQVLLFLNKRGYSPVIHCNNCNYREVCNNCNSLLVYHKQRNKLMCHHCGFTKKFSSKCSKCSSEELRMFGLGIEKLAAEVSELLPQYTKLTLTSDMLSSAKSVESALKQIIDEEVQIILGTQLISKGLHFPSLRLVAVVDSESNVMGYDPRALEHTYQILHQVAGRAGREDNKGIVVLQTYEPENPVFKCIQTFNKEEFYKYEYGIRKITKTAPFSRMFSITVIDKDEFKCIDALKEFEKMLPKDQNNLSILGPAPTPMYYMRGFYRYRIVIKAPKHLNLQKNLKEVRKAVCNAFNTKCVVDVDPYNFL